MITWKEEKSGEKRSRISYGIDQTSAPTCLGRIVLGALHLARVCFVHVKEIPVQLLLLPWGEAGDPFLGGFCPCWRGAGLLSSSCGAAAQHQELFGYKSQVSCVHRPRGVSSAGLCTCFPGRGAGAQPREHPRECCWISSGNQLLIIPSTLWMDPAEPCALCRAGTQSML